MTDFYTELALDRNKGLEEINSDLARLESIWKRREITNPEKATTMLALIIQARKVFASEASRRTYDNELDNSQRQPEKVDPGKVRSADLNGWKEQAQSYYSNGEYDLAKVAIEKAISCLSANEDDAAVFSLAAGIYQENGDLKIALSYINKAIVAEPEESTYYLTKGLIYNRQVIEILAQRNDRSLDQRLSEVGKVSSEARKVLQLADVKAEQNGDLGRRANACGLLALSYYSHYPIDDKRGEEYANLAVQLGGDSWGNADIVLKEIDKTREERKREEEKENARKRNIYWEAAKLANSDSIFILKSAISKFQSISDYEDSAQQIDNLTKRIQRINDYEKGETQRKERIREIVIPIIAVVLIAVILLVVIRRI